MSQFYAQEALKNVSNAYLAFAGGQSLTYSSPEEFKLRTGLFEVALRTVIDLNAQLKDYFVTINQLADWTADELKTLSGVRPPPTRRLLAGQLAAEADSAGAQLQADSMSANASEVSAVAMHPWGSW